MAAPSLLACQEKTVERSPATATEVGKAVTWNCYDIDVTNDQEDRNITDLHFVLPPGSAKRLKAPGGWDAAQGADGILTFKTPPPPPASGTAEKAAPIGPGKTRLGFTFCLEKPQDNVTVSISYDQGPNSAAQIVQGVEAGSRKAVRHLRTMDCYQLTLKAPSDADVYDAHLDRNAASADPQFDEVALPTGWSGGTSNGGIAIEGPATPIKKGESISIEVCMKGKPEKIDWRLTDVSHADIPGAKGTLTLKR
jgi:hypothetical protein